MTERSERGGRSGTTYLLISLKQPVAASVESFWSFLKVKKVQRKAKHQLTGSLKQRQIETTVCAYKSHHNRLVVSSGSEYVPKSVRV